MQVRIPAVDVNPPSVQNGDIDHLLKDPNFIKAASAAIVALILIVLWRKHPRVLLVVVLIGFALLFIPTIKGGGV